MTLPSREEIRSVSRRSRHAPTKPVRIAVPFDRLTVFGEEPPPGALELVIEATNAAGEIAPWFDDAWWTEAILRFADRAVTVTISATPGALLHPVVLHQMEMLRRVTPSWRITATTYLDELSTPEDVTVLARSLYHEVRFLAQRRTGAGRSDRCTWNPSVDEVFGQIRREQTRIGITPTVLVRLPSQTGGETHTATRGNESHERPLPRSKPVDGSPP